MYFQFWSLMYNASAILAPNVPIVNILVLHIWYLCLLGLNRDNIGFVCQMKQHSRGF